MSEESNWALTGDCAEACTSPPVCPYYWGSSAPTDLHGGKDQCEGAFTFSVSDGHYFNTDLGGLKMGLAFNTPEGHFSKEPWIAILYVDQRADQAQLQAIEEVFQTSWRRVGRLLAAKRTHISFIRTPVGSSVAPGYRHSIMWQGFYNLETEPLMTLTECPRYISGPAGGIIYVGRSTRNEFLDKDLPRGQWNQPEMSNTYFQFSMSPSRLDWMP